MAILAGASAGLLPAVVGRAVATLSGATGSAPVGRFAVLLGACVPNSPFWLIAATLVATMLVVGISVASSRLASALSGDLTAALRIELLRAVVHASPRAVSEASPSAGGDSVEPRPGRPGGEKRGGALVQLAVSREAALVSDFAVSIFTSLPQAVATLLVLAVELATGGSWWVMGGSALLFLASRVLGARALRRVGETRLELQKADLGVFAMLQETLSSIEDLRVWGASEQVIAEFATCSYASADARRRFAGTLAVASQVRSVFSAMSPLIVVIALQLGGGAMDAGGVAKLLLLVPLMIGRLEVLDGVRQGLVERGPVIASTLALFGLKPHPPRAPDALTIEGSKLRGELVFEDVTFTPLGATRPVLDSVSIRIPAGKVVGVCGASGSGKSTLVRLILRLDDPDRGRILLDGVDVRTIEPVQLSELFGVLRQSAQLLERELRANLLIGLRVPPDDDALRAALRTVDLLDLAEMDGPRGLDTVVSKLPPNVSGGESRRVLLARMMLGPSCVQLLDEPEAGLPSALVEELLARVVDAAGRRTLLVVTHAPHLLRSDFNVVLHDGKVAATGTHEELMQTSEEYRVLLAESLKS